MNTDRNEAGASTSRIEIALDRCLAARHAEADVAALLRRESPQVAQTVESLLEVAAELDRLPSPSPRAGAKQRLVRQLSAGGADEAVPRRRWRHTLPRVLRRTAALFALAMVLGWAMTQASANALPGEWLYPVKRAGEEVRLWLAADAPGQVALHTALSEARLAEAIRCHQRDARLDVSLLERMVQRLDRALEKCRDLPESARVAALTRITHTASYQRQLLLRQGRGASQGDQAVLERFARLCEHRCRCTHAMLTASGQPASRPVAGLEAPWEPCEDDRCPVCRDAR